MGTEGSIKRLDSAGGRDVRTIQVTTFIGGVATTVDMQVLALSDAQGNPISFASSEILQRRVAREARIHTEILLKILKAVDSRQDYTRAEILEMVNDDEPSLEGDDES